MLGDMMIQQQTRSSHIWRCNKNYSTPSLNIPSRTTLQEMQLMNKPIFILVTDNVAINVVQTGGRIFLGSRESTWLGKDEKK
ncbi:hypothetical protein GQX74_009555 [Glossina fuscipes]|nr:hypothetical protein GQX74_009555 [Glossina fuscipes]